MNAKTFLVTTEEGISWTELIPDENWDVGVPLGMLALKKQMHTIIRVSLAK